MKQELLGLYVRCTLTGVVGYASSKNEHLSGNIQYGVQPKSNDWLVMPDAWSIDTHSLEPIAGEKGVAVIPARAADIPVGARVRDKVSGFVGIAVSKTTYINGCVGYTVVPPVTKGAMFNDVPAGSYILVERLEMIDEGLLAVAQKEREVEPTGGPSLRTAANKARR
jgi:hypothetical protein